MTSRMEGEQRDRKIVITCDGAGCDQTHDDKHIAEHGGLHAMGWEMKFNDETRKLEHRCPAHKEQAVDQPGE